MPGSPSPSSSVEARRWRRVRLPRDFDTAGTRRGSNAELAFGDDSQRAFSDVLSNTSTEWRPGTSPRPTTGRSRVTAAGVLANALIEIDPRYPTVSMEARDALQAQKLDLEGQAAPGVAPDPIRVVLAEKAATKAVGQKAEKKTRKGKES